MSLPSRMHAPVVATRDTTITKLTDTHSTTTGAARTAKGAPVFVAIGVLTILPIVGRSAMSETFRIVAPVLLAQADVTDADLVRASAGRVVALGAPGSGGRVSAIPLEMYVAQVLAGEAEPGAPDGALQALAVAIRTYAIVNAGRHSRDGFDLCDTTHCQVPRPASPATRRAAMATSGRVLTYRGTPAAVFYSASCGGRSESASEAWPGLNFPYLRSVADDVHAEDVPWVLQLTLGEVEQVLRRVGFDGDRLTNVDIDARNASGRVARLHVTGLHPEQISGEQLRAVIGPRVLRSTAFTVTKTEKSLRFTGRGYGHGVGLCVIGAGRRARRGENVDAILAQYYPGLELTTLDRAATPVLDPTAIAHPADAVTRAAAVTSTSQAIIARVPRGSSLSASELERLATRAHESMQKTLGVSLAPVTIELHPSVDSFRNATGQPWWVSAAAKGTTIDLAPLSVLAQREGLEATVRIAMAELLVSPSFAARPPWVTVGAGRYFARSGSIPAASDKVRCPSAAELTLAVSAAAQREAESRAAACFARALAHGGDWREVR